MTAYKVHPVPETMEREVRPQPKVPDNGCCLHCCGKNAGSIDVKQIIADGGKFIQNSDGRIVEYFVYGATDAGLDAPVFLAINGPHCGYLVDDGQPPDGGCCAEGEGHPWLEHHNSRLRAIA